MENQAKNRPMILIVEPDALMLTGIAAVLDAKGYRCFQARDLDVALQATHTIIFDLFVVSFDEDVEEACKTADALRHDNGMHCVPVVFLSEKLRSDWKEPLHKSGGTACLTKPFEPELLIDVVDRALWMPQLALTRINPPRPHFAKDWVRLH